MQIALRIDDREIDLNTDGSLYFKTTLREVHIVRDPIGPFWPHLERLGRDEELWHGFGWRVAYSRLGETPRVRR